MGRSQRSWISNRMCACIERLHVLLSYTALLLPVEVYERVVVRRVIKEEQQCSEKWSSSMEVEASYSYGFLPAGRHQPYGPPPPHPAEDGELWEYFPCPFCYIEVEVPFICNHLQEEHCFDTRNAVCPICAENLGKDMAAHFRVQHSHLLKRRKPSKPSSWPAAANNSASGKESCEVNSYFGGSQHYVMNSRTYQDAAPDPLLSQFICTIAQTDANPGDANTQSGVSAISDDQRSSQRVTDDSSKLELQERLQRIEFLKEILMSTIL